jgi:S-(hydroxymethyl)glutathione dehydrogenase/alcohol dehydrogenase
MGGFAQQALIHENQLAVIPNQMPFPQAALLGCAVLTGTGAVLNTADVQAGETVVIIGAGGVGLNAISGAVIAGASKIIVIDIEDRKLERAKAFGATHVINSSQVKAPSEVRKLTGGGADHIFDFVGKRSITEDAKKMVTKGGAIYLVGMVDSDAGIDIPTFWGMNMQVRVEVVTMGSSNLKRDIPLYADYYLQGRLKLDELISKEISLDQINEGYEALHDGFTARVVVTSLE